jgi:uncharacterized protein (UPF0333 family)
MSYKKSILASERGQIVVEYVLLVVIGITVAAIYTSTLVSRDPDSPGFLVAKWFQMVKAIGADTADDLSAAP